jgi:hypothetical protein
MAKRDEMAPAIVCAHGGGETGREATMARRPSKATAAEALSAVELALLERLIEKGALVTKPQQPNAKARKVMAAALSHDGQHIILWLSKNTMDL